MQESEKRRPDALMEAPVTLADGQTWFLPKVRTRMVRTPNGYQYRSIVPGVPEFAGLIEQLGKAADEVRDVPRDERGDEHVDRFLNLEFAIAEALIRRNYNLTDDELAEILAWSLDEAGDPDGYAVREDIMAVVGGEGPKAGSGTDS